MTFTDPPAREAIVEETNRIQRLLIDKNRSYGNSALEPIGIFSRGTAEELLQARIDDKLSRIANQQSFVGDNDIDDLIGYLILLNISRKANNE